MWKYAAKTPCAYKGCKDNVGPKNKSGLCRWHKVIVAREKKPLRQCSECKDFLRHGNISGICGVCRSKESRRRTKTCRVCSKKLDHRTISGLCFVHLHPKAKDVYNMGKPDAPYSVAEVKEAAAWMTRISIADLDRPKGPRWLSNIRFACWAILYSHYSYGHIGRVFGGRDHSTIMHGVDRAETMIETDKNFASLVNAIKRETFARQKIERLAA